MAEARTHQAISAALCGQPLALERGRAASAETEFRREGTPVLEGPFLTIVLERHILDGRGPAPR
jgi:hypothetical protein